MNFTLQDIGNAIDVIPNFPKEGIMFRDISGLLLNSDLYDFANKQMAKLVKNTKADCIAVIDARGFLFTGIAKELNLPIVMVRKPNKLPNCITFKYEKEYGFDELCITKDVIPLGSKVLLIDDLLATGGTFDGARQLIESIGSNVVGYLSLIELVGFDIKIDRSMVYSLLKYGKDQETKELLNLNIKNYIPLVNKYESYNRTIVFYHPSVESLAENYIANNINCRKGIIIWDKFADGQPNITFENMKQLENKNIVFFISLYDKANLFEQLSMLMIMPRQLIRSLDIYITYFSVGTMERVDQEGMLATAETMAKIISNSITVVTKTGPAIIHIYDIHALPIRFYSSDNVIIKLHTAIPLLLKKLIVIVLLFSQMRDRAKGLKDYSKISK
jgi:adenine phosphoribosyltransferase